MVGPTKVKPRFRRSPAHRVRYRRLRRHLLQRRPGVLGRASVDETPDVAVEAAELLLHGQERAGVVDGRVDLQPIPDDPAVGQQALHLACTVAGHGLRIEAVECAAIALPPTKNRQPAQTRLRALEHQHLEEAPVIVQRHSPLLVVIRDVERVGRAPRAAGGRPRAHGAAGDSPRASRSRASSTARWNTNRASAFSSPSVKL